MILSNNGTEYRYWTQQGLLGIVFVFSEKSLSYVKFGIFPTSERHDHGHRLFLYSV